MIKKLVSASLVTFWLCAPALAQPAAPAAPATPSTGPLGLQLGMKYNNDARSYDLVLDPDGSCGKLSASGTDRSDEIEVCARPAKSGQRGLHLDTRWKLRAGAFEFQTSWTAEVARGATVEVGRIGGGGVRLTLTMR